jgi:hypothetical protein
MLQIAKQSHYKKSIKPNVVLNPCVPAEGLEGLVPVVM